jgi:hypothetical protein
MNPEIKAKWVAALRSGDFTQGTGALNYNDHYCCLGVLCELGRQEGVVEKEVEGLFGQYVGKDSERVTSVPPHSVMKWAGLDGSPEVVIPDPEGVYEMGGYVTLIHLNDSIRLSFSDIADIIEEKL